MHHLIARIFHGRPRLFNALLVVWWIGLCVLYLGANPPKIGHKLNKPGEVFTEREKTLLKQQSCVRDARPCPRLDLNRTDDYLVDLPHFEYVLQAAACDAKENVVVIIHSACNHFEERKSIRSSWGRGSPRLKAFTIKLIFLLALSNNSEIQERIVQEHKRHNDVVQGEWLKGSTS